MMTERGVRGHRPASVRLVSGTEQEGIGMLNERAVGLEEGQVIPLEIGSTWVDPTLSCLYRVVAEGDRTAWVLEAIRSDGPEHRERSEKHKPPLQVYDPGD